MFVSQLPIFATAREVAEFFSKAGTVRDVRLIPAEKGSRKSRGFGYVEYETPEEANKAVEELVKEKFQKRTLFIQSQLERLVTTTQKMNSVKNMYASFTAVNHNPAPVVDNNLPGRLYLGSLDFSVTEDDLREILEPYGPVQSIDIHKEENGKSKGFGFVQ